MLLKAMINNPIGVAREMDRLFDSLTSDQPFGMIPSVRAHNSYPSINVFEDAEALYAEAELPGMKLDDIEILVTEEELTIRGTRNDESPENVRPLRRERPTGAFERTIALAYPINMEAVNAKFANGVLLITLPKAEAVKPRKIDVVAVTQPAG